ncbi:hypothetical protein LXL04_021121 [Taraxacum kok-saghyz]
MWSDQVLDTSLMKLGLCDGAWNGDDGSVSEKVDQGYISKLLSKNTMIKSGPEITGAFLKLFFKNRIQSLISSYLQPHRETEKDTREIDQTLSIDAIGAAIGTGLDFSRLTFKPSAAFKPIAGERAAGGRWRRPPSKSPKQDHHPSTSRLQLELLSRKHLIAEQGAVAEDGEQVEKNVFAVFYCVLFWRKGKKHSEVLFVFVARRGICPQIISCDRTWMNKAKKQKKSQQIHEKEEESIESD